MVNEVVPHEQLMETVRALARRIALVPEPAVRLNKAIAMQGIQAAGLHAALLLEGTSVPSPNPRIMSTASNSSTFTPRKASRPTSKCATGRSSPSRWDRVRRRGGRSAPSGKAPRADDTIKNDPGNPR